jgi:DNA-binding MarR family transcriptional regulator
MSPSELGERLIVTRATVTGLVDSLERRGYATRTANPADRRSVIVAITPAGLATAQAVRELIHANEKGWMSVLTEDEIATYIGLMHRIQASVEAATG